MSFLLLSLRLLTNGYEVVWENTYLEIELTEQVSDFEDLPSAHLFYNGAEIIDPNMYYEKGVERTSLSVINTNYVKTYHVKYRVTFPKYAISKTAEITFDIVDKIAPTITFIPEYKYPLGTKLPNLKEGIEYFDNHDSANEIKISIIGLEQIKTNIVGKYNIKIQATDLSNNTAVYNHTVTIYDDIAPSIVIKKPLIINYGDKFNYTDYLEIKDNYDLILDIEIDDSKIDYYSLGSYSVKVSATDKSKNICTEIINIEIKDIEPPEIALISTIPKIEVYDLHALDRLYNYVLSLTDNYDSISINDIKINHLIDIDTLGIYDVVYEVSDNAGNFSQAKLKVSVVDQTAPKIIPIKDLEMEVFLEKPILNYYFIFSDNYTNSMDLKVVITEKINMNKTGIYEVVVSVSDENKNKAEQLFHFKVIDKTAPEITQDKELIVSNFNKQDFTNYFTITDNYSSKLKLVINDENVDYQRVGIYDCLVKVVDEALNEACLNTFIFVCDIIAPVIELSRSEVTIEVFSEQLKLESFVKNVSDNYDEIDMEDVLISEDINYNIVGVYHISFTTSDSSKNITTAILKIIIDDFIPPIIKTTLPEQIDREINLLDFVSATDNYDQNINDKIKCTPLFLDVNKPNKYEVKYYCYDSRGNYAEVITEVTVINTSNTLTFTSFLPYLLIGLFSSGIIIAIYFKNKNKNDYVLTNQR